MIKPVNVLVVIFLFLLTEPCFAIEPIKVMLARTGSVSTSEARLVLAQANNTMSNSGMAANDFVSASIVLGVDEVFSVSCPGTDSTALNLCARDKLEGKRNEKNADIVVLVAPSVTDCGGVFPGMINAPTISSANQSMAYAVVDRNCLLFPERNAKVASHEIGHLLSIEHHNNDPATGLPVIWTANHAEEDFDNLTVTGSPQDCFICNVEDFFSEDGKTFADGGSAGNSNDSDAKGVIQAIAWNTVSTYRPVIQYAAAPICTFEYSGCVQNAHQYLVSWNSSQGASITEVFMETSSNGGTSWWPDFIGGLACVPEIASSQRLFRIFGYTVNGDLTAACHIVVSGGTNCQNEEAW